MNWVSELFTPDFTQGFFIGLAITLLLSYIYVIRPVHKFIQEERRLNSQYAAKTLAQFYEEINTESK
jgi:hypothetical protein